MLKYASKRFQDKFKIRISNTEYRKFTLNLHFMKTIFMINNILQKTKDDSNYICKIERTTILSNDQTIGLQKIFIETIAHGRKNAKNIVNNGAILNE